MLSERQWAVVRLTDAREAHEQARAAMYQAASDALDAGVEREKVCEMLGGMHPNTLYKHLKRWGPPDRRGMDGRQRWWTDGARFHRGVRRLEGGRRASARER